MLQSGIAFTAFGLLKLYDSWIYYISIAVHIWRRGQARAQNTAQILQKKARERALPRLTAAVVEFQKAQCYFMLAVQIAAMVTISLGQLQPTSLQQLYNNWVVVRVVSISGVLPVTFILLCLQSIGKRSWYLIILSAVTVGVSAGTFSMTGSFSPSKNDMAYLAELPPPTPLSTIPDCGGHDPTLYCLERYLDGSELGSDSANVILIYSSIILGFLIIDNFTIAETTSYLRCRSWLERSVVYQKMLTFATRALSMTLQFLTHIYTQLGANRRYWNPATPRWILMLRNALAVSIERCRKEWRNIIICLLYATAWGFYIYYFSVLLNSYMSFLSFGMVNSAWNFGQIVGITVWAGPLVEYAYLELSTFLSTPTNFTSHCKLPLIQKGLLEGMSAANYRFLHPWALVNVQKQPESTEELSGDPFELAVPSAKNGYSSTEPMSNASTRSGYSFDQHEDPAYLGDEQHRDIVAQRLL